MLVVAAFYGCQAEERNFGEPGDTGGTASTQAGDGNLPEAGTTNVGDAGSTSVGLGGAPPNPNVVEADIVATPRLVGFRTALDGSASTDAMAPPLTYEWTMDAVPDGSTTDVSALSSTTEVNPTFFPDLGGDYTVGLTVTNANNETNTASLTFTVPTFDIPYLAVSGNASGSTRTPSLLKSDGTGAKELGCFFTEAAATEHAWLSQLGQVGQFDIDGFYPTKLDDPARLAFIRVDPDSPQMAGRLLQLASSATDCDQNLPPEITGRSLPRFSPDGSRVAFFTPREVVTVASDGTDIRIVRPADSDHQLTVAPPFWVDNKTVGWLELDALAPPSDQVIYTAPDEADGFNNLLKRKTLTNCGEVVSPFAKITQVAKTPAGVIITAHPAAVDDPTNIFLLKDVGGDKYSCLRVTVSNERISGGIANAQDFDLSPDRSQVLFMRRMDDTDINIGPLATRLYMVPADGSAGPTLLFGDDTDANNGARWAGGGEQIVWSRTQISSKNANTQRPTKGFLMIMNADGSNPRELLSVTSNVGTARVLVTGGNGCSLSRPSGGYGALASALLLGLGLLRRRRSGSERKRHGSAARRVIGALSLLGLLLAAAPAQAQSDQERAAARAAANQGGDAYDAGRYQEALGLFQNAERLVHALPHLLYIARSSEKLGKLVEAREAYLKMQRETVKPSDPEAFREAQAAASKELAAIEPRLASVTVKLDGATAQEATVTMDGQPLSAALVGLPTPTNPGEHTFEAKAPGKLPASQRVAVGEGGKQSITLTLQPDPNGAAAPAPGAPGDAAAAPGGSTEPPPGEPDHPSGGKSLRVPAYIALGVGVIGLGVGTVFIIGGSGDSKDADKKFNACLAGNVEGDKACHDADAQKAVKDLDDSAAKKKTLSVVGFAVGGAAIATGIILLVVDKGGDSKAAKHEPPRPRITPQIGFNYVGLSGSF